MKKMYLDKSRLALKRVSRNSEGSIVVPDGVMSIEKRAFAGCGYITKVALPSSLIELREKAFEGCYSLTGITIPEGVVEIPKRAFAGCSGLMAVVLPSTLKIIDKGAFEGCTSLIRIDLPEGLEIIGESAFSGCNELEAVNIPSSVTVLGKEAFLCCKKLDTIDIPEGIEHVPARCFCKSGLSHVSFPDSLITIGDRAFEKCLRLTRVEIPEGVSRIPAYCFAECENLEEVILPEGLIEIGWNAFECCKSLSSINLPDSLEIIDDWAFRVCRNLSTVNISPKVKRLGDGAFQSGCIRNMMIGALTEPLQVGDSTFYNTPIHSIIVDSNSALYTDAHCNVVMEKDTGKVVLGSVCSIIPNTATEIMKGAFGASPKFLEIPSSVKRIQKYAFSGEGCSFIVKDGVEVIEECAFMPIFWDEENVVYIPASVHTIEGQFSTVEFHLDKANPFFFYDTNGNNIISIDGTLVWGHLLHGIPEDYVNEVLAIVNIIKPEGSELSIPSCVHHVGSGIFGTDFAPFDRIIVNKGTKIDIPDDYKTACEIKVIVPTIPSASGITETIEYTIPEGVLGKEIHDYLKEDSI